MRYQGGGIGHTFQAIPRNKANVDDMDVDSDPEGGAQQLALLPLKDVTHVLKEWPEEQGCSDDTDDDEIQQEDEDMEADSGLEGELLFAESKWQMLATWVFNRERQR